MTHPISVSQLQGDTWRSHSGAPLLSQQVVKGLEVEVPATGHTIRCEPLDKTMHRLVGDICPSIFKSGASSIATGAKQFLSHAKQVSHGPWSLATNSHQKALVTDGSSCYGPTAFEQNTTRHWGNLLTPVLETSKETAKCLSMRVGPNTVLLVSLQTTKGSKSLCRPRGRREHPFRDEFCNHPPKQGERQMFVC